MLLQEAVGSRYLLPSFCFMAMNQMGSVLAVPHHRPRCNGASRSLTGVPKITCKTFSLNKWLSQLLYYSDEQLTNAYRGSNTGKQQFQVNFDMKGGNDWSQSVCCTTFPTVLPEDSSWWVWPMSRIERVHKKMATWARAAWLPRTWTDGQEVTNCSVTTVLGRGCSRWHKEKGKKGKPEDPWGDSEGSGEVETLTRGSGADWNKMQIWVQSRMEVIYPAWLKDKVSSALGGSWGYVPSCKGLWGGKAGVPQSSNGNWNLLLVTQIPSMEKGVLIALFKLF